MSLNHILVGGPGPDLALRSASLVLPGGSVSSNSGSIQSVTSTIAGIGTSAVYIYNLNSVISGNAKHVILALPRVSLTAAGGVSSALVIADAIPVGSRPNVTAGATAANWIAQVNNNGTLSVGVVNIASTGVITIYGSIINGNFTTGSTGGFQDLYISWSLPLA